MKQVDMACSCFDALLSNKKHHQHSEEQLNGGNGYKALYGILPREWKNRLTPRMKCTGFLSLINTQKTLGLSSDKNIRLFSYNELRSATENFHPSNTIGRGGFGTVYKGVLRNGVTVAAKVLSTESKQGVKEFLTEIDTITNVRHPNLVELLGCCVQGGSRILVYEHVENSSIARSLLGINTDTSKLNWDMRCAICIGVASGLAYLHEELEPPIVHRDIKASNILLDRNFSPKIGDFGLARLFPDNLTHISTCVAGTTGYLAPEYAMQGLLTKKADVYSYGVLVIEIISSRSSSWLYSSAGVMLLEWAWRLFEDGKLKELVDPALQDYPEEQILHFIKVALLCTQASAARRPPMTQVVELLSKPTKLNEDELLPPGYVEGSVFTKKNSKATISSNGSTDGNSTVSFSLSPLTFSQMLPR